MVISIWEEQRRFTDSAYEFLMQKTTAVNTPDDQSRGWSECQLRQREEERVALINRRREVLLMIYQYNWNHKNKIGGKVNPKDERELCSELDALNFVWERTRNGHIKAVAPDGKTFTFSTGGSYRGQMNQRSRLQRWKRENQQVQEEAPEVVESPPDDLDEWGLTILEAMPPSDPFEARYVANQTDLSTDQAERAIAYLVEMGMVIPMEGRFIIPTEEDEVVLSPLAVTAIEAMVEAVRQELQGDDAETYKVANEAFKSENAKLSSEIADAHGEMNILLAKARKDADTISRLNNEVEKLKGSVAKLVQQNKALEESNSKLQVIVQKYDQLKQLFN